jgi:hypothetical protein
MQRLRLYQLRGLFPQNEYVADRAVPVFVDNYDTACAVGHLMRQSGWTDEVAAIQAANNLVYVTDVHDGPLIDWVLISGLTQEEAALIQPAYEPPGFHQSLANLVAGAAIERHGLRFDNFSFLPPLDSDRLNNAGAGVYQGVYSSFPDSEMDPAFDPWLFVGSHSIGGLLNGGFGQTDLLYRFEVTAISPQARIAGASIEIHGFYNFNNVLEPDALILYSARIRAPDAVPPLVAALDFSQADFLENDQSVVTFAPRQKISVLTQVTLLGNARFTSLVHSFNLVPEPAATTLATIGIALHFVRPRRRVTL